MTIQMNLIFGALISQMVAISLLLMPMPHLFRSRIVQGWAALRQNPKYKVGLLFVSGIMVLQFVDCVQKLQRYQKSQTAMYGDTLPIGTGLTLDQLASKFYAQRNMYLSGAVLYLGLSIHTVLAIMGKLVTKETLYREAQAKSTTDDAEEIAQLKESIKKREVEISAMKKQIEGVQRSYDALTESLERSKDE